MQSTPRDQSVETSACRVSGRVERDFLTKVTLGLFLLLHPRTCICSLLTRLHLLGHLCHGGDIVEIGEIGMSRQSLPRLAVHQDLYPSYAGHVHSETLNERSQSEFFDQDSRAMPIGKCSIDIYDCQARVHQIHISECAARSR